MEEQHSRLKTWLIVAVVLGILFTCVGTLAGGLVGYGLGRRGANQGIMWRSWQQQDGQTPDNRSPRVPVLPIPDEESTPFFYQRMGAVVTEVVKDSPAKAAGIEVGDIILAVDDQPLAEAALADLIAAHEPGDRITLELWRNGQQRSVVVTLGRNPDLGGETAWLGVGYRMMPGLGGLRLHTD